LPVCFSLLLSFAQAKESICKKVIGNFSSQEMNSPNHRCLISSASSKDYNTFQQ